MQPLDNKLPREELCCPAESHAHVQLSLKSILSCEGCTDLLKPSQGMLAAMSMQQKEGHYSLVLTGIGSAGGTHAACAWESTRWTRCCGGCPPASTNSTWPASTSGSAATSPAPCAAAPCCRHPPRHEHCATDPPACFPCHDEQRGDPTRLTISDMICLSL